MENKIINYINQTPENTNPSVLATLLGELKVPKPLTYDYMPEGYPKKSVQTATLMEEQELAFALAGDTVYIALITDALNITVGQTYTVNWDGTEHKCVCGAIGATLYIGNTAIMGAGDDTGEPFIYGYNKNISSGQFATFDTSASHTISVKKIEETVTPMAEEFLPNTTAGGVTTLHINVTAINKETMEATFTADKTPVEMQQASANGPVWCVVTFAAGLMGKDAVSIGLPPAWLSSTPAFGSVIAYFHDGDGSNKIGYAVKADSSGWLVDLTQFGS